MPLGLKNKMVILHATTTTKVKIDHTKRPLLTHTPPPQPPQKYNQFLSGGEGIIDPSLPRISSKQILFEELMLFISGEVNQSTKKKNKTNMIKWMSLTLTPIKFGI